MTLLKREGDSLKKRGFIILVKTRRLFYLKRATPFLKRGPERFHSKCVTHLESGRKKRSGAAVTLSSPFGVKWKTLVFL